MNEREFISFCNFFLTRNKPIKSFKLLKDYKRIKILFSNIKTILNSTWRTHQSILLFFWGGGGCIGQRHMNPRRTRPKGTQPYIYNTYIYTSTDFTPSHCRLFKTNITEWKRFSVCFTNVLSFFHSEKGSDQLTLYNHTLSIYRYEYVHNS